MNDITSLIYICNEYFIIARVSIDSSKLHTNICKFLKKKKICPMTITGHANVNTTTMHTHPSIFSESW